MEQAFQTGNYVNKIGILLKVCIPDWYKEFILIIKAWGTHASHYS